MKVEEDPCSWTVMSGVLVLQALEAPSGLLPDTQDLWS